MACVWFPPQAEKIWSLCMVTLLSQGVAKQKVVSLYSNVSPLKWTGIKWNWYKTIDSITHVKESIKKDILQEYAQRYLSTFKLKRKSREKILKQNKVVFPVIHVPKLYQYWDLQQKHIHRLLHTQIQKNVPLNFLFLAFMNM